MVRICKQPKESLFELYTQVQLNSVYISTPYKIFQKIYGQLLTDYWFSNLNFTDYSFFGPDFTDYSFFGLGFTDYLILGLNFTDYWFLGPKFYWFFGLDFTDYQFFGLIFTDFLAMGPYNESKQYLPILEAPLDGNLIIRCVACKNKSNSVLSFTQDFLNIEFAFKCWI